VHLVYGVGGQPSRSSAKSIIKNSFCSTLNSHLTVVDIQYSHSQPTDSMTYCTRYISTHDRQLALLTTAYKLTNALHSMLAMPHTTIAYA